jgi:hypothetical protein
MNVIVMEPEYEVNSMSSEVVLQLVAGAVLP